MPILLLALITLLVVGLVTSLLDRSHTGSLPEWISYLGVTFRTDTGELRTADTRTSAELRESAIESAMTAKELRDLPADKRSDTWAVDIRNATAALHADDALLQFQEKEERAFLQALRFDEDVRNPPRPESRGPNAAWAELGPEHRSLLDLVTGNDEYQAWQEKRLAGSGDAMPEIVIEGRSIGAEYRTLLDSTAGGSGPAGLIQTMSPVAPTPRQQRFFLRDLLTVTGLGVAAMPYVRELSPATNETGASSVAESAQKPEAVMQFENDTAVAKKIAVWIPATEEILADAPTLQGYIYGRLAYMIQVRETQQILTGNGSGSDLKGIFVYSGIQTVTTATNGDPFVDFTTAIGKVENVDLDANGIVMNPIDYWTSLGLRHSTQFDGGASAQNNAPFGGPPGTIWGLPVVRSRAVTTLTAYVADWANGAILMDRMQTTIRQSDSHDTFFVYNKIAILAEERVALAVTRPDAFVKVTIDITA